MPASPVWGVAVFVELSVRVAVLALPPVLLASLVVELAGVVGFREAEASSGSVESDVGWFEPSDEARSSHTAVKVWSPVTVYLSPG